MRDRFLMHHGRGHHTRLYRRKVEKWVWRDSAKGVGYTVEFRDDAGHPVDIFGEPIDGEFLKPSSKNDLTSGNGTPISPRPTPRKEN